MKILFSFILFTGMYFNITAQRIYDTTTTNVMNEVLSLQAFLGSTEYLSFSATYYMEDVDSTTVKDTLTASYKINGEQFHIVMDSIESIQNDQYTGTIYFKDSLIVVQKPTPMATQVLQIDVMDTLFQQIAMTGMSATDSGLFRKIVVQFDPEAIYTNYEIVYEKANNHLNYIKYSLRKDLDVESPKRINMTIKFSQFNTSTFSDSVFSTDTFFKVENSSDLKSAGNSTVDFEIVNLLK